MTSLYNYALVRFAARLAFNFASIFLVCAEAFLRLVLALSFAIFSLMTLSLLCFSLLDLPFLKALSGSKFLSLLASRRRDLLLLAFFLSFPPFNARTRAGFPGVTCFTCC